MTDRPTWDDTWMQVAHVVSKRSLCIRAQVGAVIVTPANRIVATGYNGPPAGYPHEGKPCDQWCWRAITGPLPVTRASYEDCPSLHAEANALSVCDRTTREGGTMYVTGFICFTCAKLIANSGLKTVVVLADEQYAYRNPADGYALLDTCGVEVIEVP